MTGEEGTMEVKVHAKEKEKEKRRGRKGERETTQLHGGRCCVPVTCLSRQTHKPVIISASSR